MNSKILNEIDKIIKYIKNTEEYQSYIYLREKLLCNEKANNLISEIKNLQKKIVKLEQEKKDVTKEEERIKNNLAELNKIPLYVEFIEKQEFLDDMYQKIKKKLDEYFYNQFN